MSVRNLIPKVCLIVLILKAGISSGQEKMEVEGAITIKDAKTETPVQGTIRFNPKNNDFEGWNGLFWASLTGFQFTNIGSVVDVDGNTYPTVKIGNQEWMAENLRTTRYHDVSHSSIPLISNNISWVLTYSGAYCIYDTISSGYDAYLKERFGYLYNWYAVVDSRGLCPTGWHIPSSSDWNTLFNAVGGSSQAGGRLKESGLNHWNSPNYGATNSSGYTALPAGERFASTGSFLNIGIYSRWWSISLSNNEPLFFYVLSNDEFASGSTSDRRTGYPVRCLKN
ncbi:MAG: fibrobacter succinogenes major paralogous domain-containing protein [Saprospiraceae bacterium]|nr:fibrobacter succinogenes major paralogous domain-containing protein [Saprospiraceae bacterium]